MSNAAVPLFTCPKRRRLPLLTIDQGCALADAVKRVGSWKRDESVDAGGEAWIGTRPILFAVFATLLAGGAQAAKFNSTEQTQIEEPRPADVPSDATMEAAGATIGAIELQLGQIFDERDPRENSGLYRLANELHVRTKQSTIRAQLLFRPGDKYDARKLAETERNLRAVPYIYDAHVVPVKYVDGKVTVRVITKDVWTLSPGVSFGRSGGANSSGFDLSDSNLLGLGKSLAISHSSDVDRTSTGVRSLIENTPGAVRRSEDTRPDF